MTFCQTHGAELTEAGICLVCYDEQTERVERESLPLRIANTTEATRAKALELSAQRNGAG